MAYGLSTAQVFAMRSLLMLLPALFPVVSSWRLIKRDVCCSSQINLHTKNNGPRRDASQAAWCGELAARNEKCNKNIVFFLNGAGTYHSSCICVKAGETCDSTYGCHNYNAWQRGAPAPPPPPTGWRLIKSDVCCSSQLSLNSYDNQNAHRRGEFQAAWCGDLAARNAQCNKNIVFFRKGGVMPSDSCWCVKAGQTCDNTQGCARWNAWQREAPTTPPPTPAPTEPPPYKGKVFWTKGSAGTNCMTVCGGKSQCIETIWPSSEQAFKAVVKKVPSASCSSVDAGDWAVNPGEYVEYDNVCYWKHDNPETKYARCDRSHYAVARYCPCKKPVVATTTSAPTTMAPKTTTSALSARQPPSTATTDAPESDKPPSSPVSRRRGRRRRKGGRRRGEAAVAQGDVRPSRRRRRRRRRRTAK